MSDMDSMEGGRLLGEGSYGCAFTPPLICKDKKKRQGVVGKITDAVDGIQEINVANALRNVPLVKNYFLLPEPEYCLPAAEQKDPEFKDCYPLFRKNEYRIALNKTIQIFEPFGGSTPFYSIMDSGELHPRKFDFYGFVRHMLEAGSTLLVAGVCHFDLHPGNILLDNKGVPRILDFGMAFTSKEINRELVDNRWKILKFSVDNNETPVVLNAMPPELTIMTAIHNEKYSAEQAVSLTVAGKPLFRDMEKYLNISKTRSYNELKRFWDTSESAEAEDWVKIYKLYWPGFDSWSLGSIFLTILKTLMTWTQFTQGPWVQKQSMVLAALRGLLHPNPRERFDCMEALAIFDPGNEWIRRFGTKWLEARQRQRQAVKKAQQ
jgi:serine/threonine protein kinase